MLKAMMTVYYDDHTYSRYDVLLSGRKIVRIVEAVSPYMVARGETIEVNRAELLGKVAAMTKPHENDGSDIVLVYAVNDVSNLRFVRVYDIGGPNTPYFSDIRSMLSEPIDNIKTVLEFLSL